MTVEKQLMKEESLVSSKIIRGTSDIHHSWNTLPSVRLRNGSSKLSANVTASKDIKTIDDDLTNLTWLQDTNLLKNIHVGGSNTKELIANKDESEKSSVNQDKDPSDIQYDPFVHIKVKPPYSFSCLIFMAIENSPSKALPVKDIYSWILNHFPYFQQAPNGWKNSVRHNLSLNKCFRKIEKKGQNIAKGSLWSIDPEFRPNLIQALQKGPRYSNTHGKEFHDLPQCQKLYSTSGSISSSLSTENDFKIPTTELFPYLYRQLAVSSLKDTEVDAAATMLALKNGPNVVDEQDYNEELDVKTASTFGKQRRVHTRFRPFIPGYHFPWQKRNSPLNSNNPIEDHTYSVCFNQLNNNLHISEEDIMDVTDGSHTLLKKPKETVDEERQKQTEGAHALLNLAKVATVRRQFLRIPESQVSVKL